MIKEKYLSIFAYKLLEKFSSSIKQACSQIHFMKHFYIFLKN